MKSLRIYLFISIVSIATFISCKDRKVRPGNILPKKDFVNILTDLSITEALIDKKGISADSSFAYRKADFLMILKNYETTQTTFENTYTFYLQNPDDLDLVYLDVINNLSRLQAESVK